MFDIFTNIKLLFNILRVIKELQRDLGSIKPFVDKFRHRNDIYTYNMSLTEINEDCEISLHNLNKEVRLLSKAHSHQVHLRNSLESERDNLISSKSGLSKKSQKVLDSRIDKINEKIHILDLILC